jgi:hypothetical protein
VSAHADGSTYALLAGGTTVEIRQAGPDDFDAVRGMHEQMSPDNLYLRFFSMISVAAEQAVPVLGFNGEADPQDPPRIMAGIQKFWLNSRDLAVPGQGHNTNSDIWAACLGPWTQTFIEQASAAHLGTSCLATASAPPFDLTLHDIASGG